MGSPRSAAQEGADAEQPVRQEQHDDDATRRGDVRCFVRVSWGATDLAAVGEEEAPGDHGQQGEQHAGDEQLHTQRDADRRG